MHTYDVRDVWMSLKLATKNFFTLIVLIWIPLILLIINTKDLELENSTLSIVLKSSIALSGLIFIQSIIIYLANRKYLIDLETGLVKFPRSDMENSIFAIILLFPYWNLMRTMTIHANDIENIYIDTKRWSTKSRVSDGRTTTGKTKYRTKITKHVLYTINIVGIFGSANLAFLDRQKRDEVRNAIQQCVKQHTGKNVDRKVAEFN